MAGGSRLVPDPTNEQVRERLRAVFWPGFDQGILAAGFARGIEVRDGAVRIGSSSGPHAQSRRLGRRDSPKRASATIAAVAESIERERARHWDVSVRVAPNTQRADSSK